jgi:hypothetical protein
MGVDTMSSSGGFSIIIIRKGTHLYIDINTVDTNKSDMYVYINHSCSRLLPDLGPGTLIPVTLTL